MRKTELAKKMLNAKVCSFGNWTRKNKLQIFVFDILNITVRKQVSERKKKELFDAVYHIIILHRGSQMSFAKYFISRETTGHVFFIIFFFNFSINISYILKTSRRLKIEIKKERKRDSGSE